MESERFQSPYSGKWDGIDYSAVVENVLILVGDVEWRGWIFGSDLGVHGLFIEGQHWQEVDLRKGLVAILDLASDCLNCQQLVIRLENTLEETRKTPHPLTLAYLVSLLRVLMPLGFQLLHPNSHPHTTGTLIGMTI